MAGDKFARFRAARAAGTSVAETTEDLDDALLYDEVDEDTFRKRRRDELLKDDFVVEDEGYGYADTGADDWDERSRPQYHSDNESDDGGVKKKHTRKVKKQTTAAISQFFKPVGAEDKPLAKKTADVDDILDDLYSKPLATPFAARTRDPFLSTKRSGGKMRTPFLAKRARMVKMEDSDEEVPVANSSFELALSPTKPRGVKQEPVLPQGVKQEPSLPIRGDSLAPSLAATPATVDSDLSEDELVARRPRTKTVARSTLNRTAVKELSLPTRLYTPLLQIYSLPLRLLAKLTAADIGPTFSMYWLDYAEVDNTILLFGKVQTASGELVLGVVQVTDMCRELYFLPRATVFDLELDTATDEPVSVDDVQEEIVPLLLAHYGLDNIRAKSVHMKYAFELPGIPAESDYLKVLLPFKTPKAAKPLPENLLGSTFNHVFGTTTALFELFVLQRNIMGPCWLEFANPDYDAIANSSHCRVEAAVKLLLVRVLPENTFPLPGLTAMAIAIQTVLNPKTNAQEVASVLVATYHGILPDTPVDSKRAPDELVTLVRPVGRPGLALPPGLVPLAQKLGMELRTFVNEALMLNMLAGLVRRTDPDVFVGHRLENILLDVLVRRMYDLKVAMWLAFGRRTRKQWPGSFNGAAHSMVFHIRDIFAGRLLCDIANEMGQLLTMKCQLWDLPEMYQVVCHATYLPMEVNYNDGVYSDDPGMLVAALKDLALAARYTAEIGFAIQILLLSKVLTQLAGNAWSHTLSGTRAGRNEFILLHEFTRSGYIVPDKLPRYGKNQPVKPDIPEEDAATATLNKKPKYQGGLVFEPEKGLHTNYILVMDFNSLYPSIIQEWNVCFTTVDRPRVESGVAAPDVVPALPPADVPQGILPKLLQTLVLRRREVKKLMKSALATADELALYDVKQQALKLTANSMYGCLGYVNLRFYAKPLAMLVTNKGREVLMDTRQLAELMELRVVYGDTDSVMIDAGCHLYAEAIEVGEQFKKRVNEQYRMMEIDTDNVFKRLLLHAKKKYAALNVLVVDGEERTVLEVKGLDMRRREYCQLLKEISTYVLQQVFADTDPETLLNTVYEYLEQQSTALRENQVRPDKLKINTRLSRDPGSYAGGKTMPSVQAAFRMIKDGKVVKAGLVVTYVICKGDEEHFAARAHPFTDLLRKGLTLVPDADYYLDKQIFAPVERLLEQIEGADMRRVCAALGLDTRKYELRVQRNLARLEPLEATVLDAERFRDAARLELVCGCGERFPFLGIAALRRYTVVLSGIRCSKCGEVLAQSRVNARLEYVIREHIRLYYEGWLVCDDAACGVVTRQVLVYGRRCLSGGCKGIMRYRASDKQVYNQLLYLDGLFDADKAKAGVAGEEGVEAMPRGQVEALALQNREQFQVLRLVVDKYLRNCGRRYVDMKGLFSV